MNEQIKITKDKIIRSAAKQSKVKIRDAKNFYNEIEKIIFDNLSIVNEEQDVCIKLFEGINLCGKYEPEKTKKDNLSGKEKFVDSKIKPKFYITRSYCEKLNKK